MGHADITTTMNIYADVTKAQKGLLDFMENLENGTLRDVKNIKENEETDSHIK